MEKFVAVVFDTEEQAFAGAEALRALHRNGDLTVYAAAVLAKDEDGTTHLKQTRDEGPVGTALGLSLGALVGVLAGPAAVASGAVVAGTAAAAQAAATGALFGSATGGLFGLYRDLWVQGVDVTFLEQVSLELLPGKSCLLASVDETWTTPLDTRMQEAGGSVFRKPRIEAVDEQWEAEVRALNAEIDQLEEELREAHEDNKAALREKVDAAKARLKAQNDRVNARLDEMDAELDARLKALDEQIATATERNRQKFVDRKEQITADYRRRKDLLARSTKLAREAFAA